MSHTGHRTLREVAATLALGAACVCPRGLAAQRPATPEKEPTPTHAPARTRCPCAFEGVLPLAPELGLPEQLLFEPAIVGSLEDALVASMTPELAGPQPELLAMAGSEAAWLDPELAWVDRDDRLEREPRRAERELLARHAWGDLPGRAARPFATVPPAPVPSLQGQPADSVYRLARQRLNQGRFAEAATLFRQIVERWPDSKYAADALYWNAFALYRTGSSGDLKRALDALHEQQLRYPNAATHGDAEALAVRINGELARGGDTEAAEIIAAQAAEIEAQAIAQAQPLVDAAMAQSIAAATAGARAAPRGKHPTEAEAAEMGREAGELEAHAAQIDRHAAELGKQAEALGRGVAALARGIDDDHLPPQCAAQQDKQEMRIAALNALLQMDAEQAVPVLRDVLKRRDECSAPLRRKAVFVVSQKPNAETEDILLDAVRNDPDPGVRAQAVWWLSQVPGERSLKAIEDVLATSKDPMIQERALFALSQHRSPEAAAALRRFTTNENVNIELRERAISMLGLVSPSPENSAFLRELYRKTDDSRIKERIVTSMMGADDEASGRFLEEVALDPKASLDVRKKAVFIASQHGQMSVPTLKRIYDSPIPKDMKEQIIFALGQRKDGIDQLIEIARHESNPGFRSKAIFWLGQSKDPRAVKVLQEILSQ